jgi:hypothetical protein
MPRSVPLSGKGTVNEVQGEIAMGKMKWLVVGILFLTCSASAQETPKAEVSVGYSYLRLGGSGGLSQHGGSFSVSGNANRWLGIVADFGFYHASPFGVGLNTTTFMVGPRFSARSRNKVTPFVQALTGGAHMTSGVSGFSTSVTPFAMSAGGGVDLELSPHVALRPEVDYIALRSRGQTLNSGRASFGIVFRFGGR